MEILERKDNPLLNRVEIKFVWNHPGEGTPTRKDMVIAAAKSEPLSEPVSESVLGISFGCGLCSERLRNRLASTNRT